MPKLDEIKARIDWLKELFKIMVTIMVADIAGMAKLYLDNTVNIVFYMGGFLLPLLAVACILISKKIEHHFDELERL
jgi:hypothetical protein